MRYIGQFHEVEVPVADGTLDHDAVAAAVAGFHAKHDQLYTFDMPWQQVELLTFRVRATTPRAAIRAAARRARRQRRQSTPSSATVRPGSTAPCSTRPSTMAHACGQVTASTAPRIIEEATTTVVVPSSYSLVVDDYRNYILTARRRRQPA